MTLEMEQIEKGISNRQDRFQFLQYLKNTAIFNISTYKLVLGLDIEHGFPCVDKALTSETIRHLENAIIIIGQLKEGFEASERIVLKRAQMSEPFNPLTNLQNNLRIPLEQSEEKQREIYKSKKKTSGKKHRKKSSLMNGETTFRARGANKIGR